MATTARVPEGHHVARPAAQSAASGRAARGWRWFLLGVGALAAVTAFVPPSSGARWIPVAAGVLAVVAVVEGSLAQLRSDGLRGGLVREPLVLIGVGLCLTVAGESLRAGGASSLTYADGVSLAAYPFFIAGMVRLTRSRLKEGAIDTLLVAAIAPAAVCAFAWVPLVEAIGRWTEQAGEQSWQVPLFLAVDALAVAIIARLAVMFRGRPIAYQFLLGASACMLGAHVSRAVSDITQVIPSPLGSQTLLVAGFALFGASALHPSIRRGRGVRTRVVTVGRAHVALLMVAVVVGPALAMLRYGDRGGWVVLVAAGPALVSLLVVAHLSRMITERQRLEFASNHDALTGLANRGRFYERLGAGLDQVASRRHGLAVMFIDLDRFKNVNDTHGHDVGDELLRAVARRLRDCVRDTDLVARLAGDEFAVLLMSDATEETVAEVSRRLLAGFADPIRVGERTLSTTLSIGTAFSPQHGEDADTLLRNADSAMYVAKASGRNNAQMYREGMQTRAHQRLVVEARLRGAIDNHELALHYQPKLDAATGAIVGVEALVRWDHPSHGLIPPGAFMHSAEESGLVAPLGTWVLFTACRQAEEWRRAGHGDLSMSVNISARQFELQDVPTLVASALTESGLPPRLLELELTESLRLDGDRNISDSLHALEALGVRCSIDDFGTGYSNISYLHAYPIDTVKLDRSFVQTVTGPAVDSPLVRGVIALAHSLGMRVVAEGVETQDQLAFLQQHSCDEWQGFLFSPGVPAADMTSLLRQGAIAGSGGWPLLAVPGDLLQSTAWDEKRLREVLWRELGISGLQRRADDDTDDNRHRGVVLTGASGVMALPVFLGLGSAGGLPPAVQGRLDSTLGAVGVVALHDPTMRIGGDGVLVAGDRSSGKAVGAAGAGSGAGSDSGGTVVDVPLGMSDPRSPGVAVSGDGGDGDTATGTTEDPVSVPAAPATTDGEVSLSPGSGSGNGAAPVTSGPGRNDDHSGAGNGHGGGAQGRGPDRDQGDGTTTDPGGGSDNGTTTDPGTGTGNGQGNGNGTTGPGTGNGNGNGNGNGTTDPGAGTGTTDPGSGNGNGNGITDPGAGNGNGQGSGNSNGNATTDPGTGNGQGNGTTPGTGTGTTDPGTGNGITNPGTGNGPTDPGAGNGPTDPGAGNGPTDPGNGNGSGTTDPGAGNGQGNGNGSGTTDPGAGNGQGNGQGNGPTDPGNGTTDPGAGNGPTDPGNGNGTTDPGTGNGIGQGNGNGQGNAPTDPGNGNGNGNGNGQGPVAPPGSSNAGSRGGRA